MSSKSSDDDAIGIFVLILLFLVIPGFGHFIWGITHGDPQLKMFYAVAGSLTFTLSIIILAIIDNRSISSSLTLQL